MRQAVPLGIIVYTGFSFDEIRNDPLTALCDAIIDGPYIAGLDDGRSLRGSANQQLILLTSRYAGLIPFGTVRRQTELVQPIGGGLAQVGVPGKPDIQRTEALRLSLKKE